MCERVSLRQVEPMLKELELKPIWDSVTSCQSGADHFGLGSITGQPRQREKRTGHERAIKGSKQEDWNPLLVYAQERQ